MRPPARAAAFILLALSATGCARLHARAPRVAGPLEAPAPPAHVVPPLEEVKAPDPPPPVVAETPPRPAPRPATPPQTPAAPQRAERSDPAAAAPVVPAVPDPTPPRTTLQTTANVEAVERQIRRTLADATRDLSRIDYRGLNVEGKAQYDIARRFVQQAEEALVAKNFLFASQLADKASVLATLLTR